MRHGILHDEGLDPIRMRQSHTKPHRTAVVLHVKCVAREPERLGEMSHDLRVVIEAVRESLWIRPIAVPEARVVGSQKVKAIGKARAEARTCAKTKAVRAAANSWTRPSGPTPDRRSKARQPSHCDTGRPSPQPCSRLPHTPCAGDGAYFVIAPLLTVADSPAYTRPVHGIASGRR
jgi:hypothetical protein